jgi:hypothetical protein
VPLQWQQYERKVSERGSEQHSALAKSAGLLDSMRKRFGTPGGGDLLATPRADLAGPHGGLIPAHLAAAAAGLDTPRSSSGASLKENFGAELNRSGATTTLFHASQPPAPMAVAATPVSTGSFAAAAAAAMAAGPGSGGPVGDSMLQQASNLFLQQVEDMRRKHTAEVERLQVGAGC